MTNAPDVLELADGLQAERRPSPSPSHPTPTPTQPPTSVAPQGLATRHFDAILGHFVGTLEELGVQQVGPRAAWRACVRGRAPRALAVGLVLCLLTPPATTVGPKCLFATDLCRM